MNQDLGLKILGRVMNWDDDRARKEFAWLKLMARLKYDGYRDFQAGMRFIESLVTWLQQFEANERETAYTFIRRNLVYVGPSEMQQLVDQFYPRFVQERIVRMAASESGVASHRALVEPASVAKNMLLHRKTLFMGLSDGARIDTIRHANAGVLSNEQFVQGTQVDPDKWRDLLENLRRDLEDTAAGFRIVYLVDDFTGTGTSFLRFDDNATKWKGKLIRFRDSVLRASSTFCGDNLFEEGWVLCVHHYLASSAAVAAIRKHLTRTADDGVFPDDWARHTYPTFGMVLPNDLPINPAREQHEDFIRLTRTYYDPVLRTKHTDVGGEAHLGLGYGGCALPLVLEHNTPNNSVALLWAETDGGTRNGTIAPAMRPLFRRRQRHE